MTVLNLDPIFLVKKKKEKSFVLFFNWKESKLSTAFITQLPYESGHLLPEKYYFNFISAI